MSSWYLQKLLYFLYWSIDSKMQWCYSHISVLCLIVILYFMFFCPIFPNSQRMFTFRLMILLCCFLFNAYYVRKSSSFLGMPTSVIQSPWENGWEKTYWRVRLPSLFYQNDIDKLVGQRYSLLMHLQYCRIFYRIFVKSKRLGPMTFLYRVCLHYNIPKAVRQKKISALYMDSINKARKLNCLQARPHKL